MRAAELCVSERFRKASRLVKEHQHRRYPDPRGSTACPMVRKEGRHGQSAPRATCDVIPLRDLSQQTPAIPLSSRCPGEILPLQRNFGKFRDLWGNLANFVRFGDNSPFSGFPGKISKILGQREKLFKSLILASLQKIILLYQQLIQHFFNISSLKFTRFSKLFKCLSPNRNITGTGVVQVKGLNPFFIDGIPDNSGSEGAAATVTRQPKTISQRSVRHLLVLQIHDNRMLIAGPHALHLCYLPEIPGTMENDLR